MKTQNFGTTSWTNSTYRIVPKHKVNAKLRITFALGTNESTDIGTQPVID